MQQVGESEDTVYAQEIGETIGKDISQLGFNVDFAPVADVNTSELNKEIGNRSFGSDTKLVSNMVTSFVKGLQSTNVSATLKHFPGQGSSTGNTHEGAVNLDKDIDNLRKTDFKPFQAGIKAGADFIMVSHVSISRVTENTLPASMSDIVMQSILRTEFGFDGIIITDAMDMTAITSEYTAAEAAVASISAGADIVLMPQNYEEAINGVLAAVEDGTIPESRINESVQRILQVKVKRGLLS
jgi:beta-N-acetylhexosaminidase